MLYKIRRKPLEFIWGTLFSKEKQPVRFSCRTRPFITRRKLLTYAKLAQDVVEITNLTSGAHFEVSQLVKTQNMENEETA